MTHALAPELVARFVAIVGEPYALRDPADIAPYVEERRRLWPGASALVLRPGSTEEVAAILRLATETGTPIVPQGGNTGLVGGQMPDGDGGQVVVSLSRLNRIRELDLQSNTVTVEAGVVLQTLREKVEAADRLFPLSLGSMGTCQIGGNLSSNAGGTGALAFGSARELCLGVEVVLPTGEVLDDLRKLKKDNTGYDLKNLFVGGEGTLGIITAAVLKLFPRPRGVSVAWVGLESPEKALELFTLAEGRANAMLTGFELIVDLALQFTLRHLPGAQAPLTGAHPWHVLMEISSGRSQEEADALAEEILGEAFEKGLVDDAVIGQSIAQGDAFWAMREAMSDSQIPEGFSIKHDISVPVVAIPEFIERGSRIVLDIAPHARIACFGHMGDGNLHFNISEPQGGDAQFRTLYRPMNDAVHALVRELNGSFSAEHGIGKAKRDELIATAPPIAIDLMRRIKKAFDPAGIMNPGKVI